MILNYINEQMKVEGLERAGRVTLHHVQLGQANLNNSYEIKNKNVANFGALYQRLLSFQHGQDTRKS